MVQLPSMLKRWMRKVISGPHSTITVTATDPAGNYRDDLNGDGIINASELGADGSFDARVALGPDAVGTVVKR